MDNPIAGTGDGVLTFRRGLRNRLSLSFFCDYTGWHPIGGTYAPAGVREHTQGILPDVQRAYFSSDIQGPYLYSYAINDRIGANLNPQSPSYDLLVKALPRTKFGQWPGRNGKSCSPRHWVETTHPGTLVDECGSPCTAQGLPLALRHGQRSGQNSIENQAPGQTALRGKTPGCNVSAVFFDGHAASIDEDVNNEEPGHWAPTP